MTSVLNSVVKNFQNEEDLSSNLSINKKSKTTNTRDKYFMEVNSKDNQQKEDWNIDLILSNIFSYADHKDLVELNTVCKKWSHLTNPIIHKTIRLNRNWDAKNQLQDNRFLYYADPDAEVTECIANNAKNAHFVKDFYYRYELEPRRAIEIFDTFRFISKLTIERIDISQDQFLGMISPLTQLQELTLNSLSIKRIIYKRLYKEVVQLPSSLKKLSLSVNLVNNPDLFIQTINSHKNLVEFSYSSFSNNEFFEPFYKPYPSLLKFEYSNSSLQNPQSLIKIFEQNRQLTSLKLSLKCWNSELTSCISRHLTNLEELNFTEYSWYNQSTDQDLKFFQPTKIKKLKLIWSGLNNSSLDSILQNCPHLEELTLNRERSYNQLNSKTSINLPKSLKVKKLNINCENLNVAVLSTLLLNCPDLNELVINLPTQCREFVNEILENSLNLQRLEIIPPRYCNEKDIFFQEFCNSEFFTRSSKIKSNLTHLTLNGFNAQNSKADHFKNFEKLKSIKYKAQYYHSGRKFGKKYKIYMKLWPGYKMFSTESLLNYELEFKKFSF